VVQGNEAARHRVRTVSDENTRPDWKVGYGVLRFEEILRILELINTEQGSDTMYGDILRRLKSAGNVLPAVFLQVSAGEEEGDSYERI
jgi:hypothetical protein